MDALTLSDVARARRTSGAGRARGLPRASSTRCASAPSCSAPGRPTRTSWRRWRRELAPDLALAVATGRARRARRGRAARAGGRGRPAPAQPTPADLLAAPAPAPVVLLEDPRHLGNLGACVRVAAAAGAAGVLTTGAPGPVAPGRAARLRRAALRAAGRRARARCRPATARWSRSIPRAIRSPASPGRARCSPSAPSATGCPASCWRARTRGWRCRCARRLEPEPRDGRRRRPVRTRPWRLMPPMEAQRATSPPRDRPRLAGPRRRQAARAAGTRRRRVPRVPGGARGLGPGRPRLRRRGAGARARLSVGPAGDVVRPARKRGRPCGPDAIALDGRHPLLAFGANGSPEGLERKLAHFERERTAPCWCSRARCTAGTSARRR